MANLQILETRSETGDCSAKMAGTAKEDAADAKDNTPHAKDNEIHQNNRVEEHCAIAANDNVNGFCKIFQLLVCSKIILE